MAKKQEALLQLQMSEISSDISTEKDSSKKRLRSNDNDDNPCDTEVIVKCVVQNPSRINEVTMGNVDISPLSANPIRKVRKKKYAHPMAENEFFKLVSIMGVFACDLSVNEMRNFCSNNGLVGRKFNNKKSICDTIAIAKQFPLKVKEEATFKKRVYVNNKKYCNVIFIDGICPLLANRGEPLTQRIS